MSQKGHAAPQIARQGHRYHLHQKNVLALESGLRVKVLYYDPEKPWYGRVIKVFASELKPQPMKYHGNQLP